MLLAQGLRFFGRCTRAPPIAGLPARGGELVEGVQVVGQVGVGIGLVPAPQLVHQCLGGDPHLTTSAGLLNALTGLIEHGLLSG